MPSIITIMRNDSFFKHQSKSTSPSDIPQSYDREARNFQKSYNQKHPHAHIWRHVLYKRSFRFIDEAGNQANVSVTIVRFIVAGTNYTFTFYGSLLLSFSHYTAEFVRKAAAASRFDEDSAAVSERTVRRWQLLLKKEFEDAYSISRRIESPILVHDNDPVP